MPCRISRFRSDERSLRTQETAGCYRGVVCGEFSLHGMGRNFFIVCDLVNHWWRGDRHCFECFADLYRGNQPSTVAGTDGHAESIDHCCRDSGGTNRQLADRREGSRWRYCGNDPAVLERAIWLALDVHDCGHSRSHLFFHRILHTFEPALDRDDPRTTNSSPTTCRELRG